MKLFVPTDNVESIQSLFGIHALDSIVGHSQCCIMTSCFGLGPRPFVSIVYIWNSVKNIFPYTIQVQKNHNVTGQILMITVNVQWVL